MANYFEILWAEQGHRCLGCQNPGEMLDMVGHYPDDDGDPTLYCKRCAEELPDDWPTDVGEVGFDWDENTLWVLEDNTCTWCGGPNGLIFMHDPPHEPLYKCGGCVVEDEMAYGGPRRRKVDDEET